MFKSIILGAPASGKGTISAKIVKHFDIFHLSIGDILRNEIKNNTKLGQDAKVYVEDGILVPDSLIFGMLKSELNKLAGRHWLLDGFPRTVEQAEKLHDMEKVNMVINLVVPFEIIIDRAKGRLVHVPSGRVYNVAFNAPKVPGKDDVTGEPLEQREDDKPETVRKRLESYQQLVEPILEFYKQKNLLHNFEGKSSEVLWNKICTAMSLHLQPKK